MAGAKKKSSKSIPAAPLEIPVDGQPKAAVEATVPEVPSQIMRRKEFLDRVVAAAEGVKPAQARQVADVVMGELFALLARGEGVALPPHGRMKVAKQVGDVISVRVRLAAEVKKPGISAKQGLAEPAGDE